MKRTLKTAILVAVIGLAMTSQAATVIAAGTNTVEACGFAVNPTAQLAGTLDYPADWKIVVVCNEVVWDGLMRQAKVNYVSDYAFTFQPTKVTFIRARVFTDMTKYRPRWVLAHELGHIVCRCDNEDKADKYADKVTR